MRGRVIGLNPFNVKYSRTYAFGRLPVALSLEALGLLVGRLLGSYLGIRAQWDCRGRRQLRVSNVELLILFCFGMR